MTEKEAAIQAYYEERRRLEEERRGLASVQSISTRDATRRAGEEFIPLDPSAVDKSDEDRSLGFAKPASARPPPSGPRPPDSARPPPGPRPPGAGPTLSAEKDLGIGFAKPASSRGPPPAGPGAGPRPPGGPRPPAEPSGPRPPDGPRPASDGPRPPGSLPSHPFSFLLLLLSCFPRFLTWSSRRTQATRRTAPALRAFRTAPSL